jgi:hypothetical protein
VCVNARVGVGACPSRAAVKIGRRPLLVSSSV